VARELGIKGVWTTLDRWIVGQANPRASNLKKLPALFPEHAAELQRLIAEEFPALWPGVPEMGEHHIPSVYYERVVDAIARNPRRVAVWTIYQLGMLQLLSHVGQDCEIAILKCSPSGKSLYQVTGMRHRHPVTPPLRFVGKEHLAGQAVQQNGIIEQEQSIAVPMRRYGEAGGCLMVSGLATPPVRLLEHYANMFAFACSTFHEAPTLLTIPEYIQQEVLFVGERDFTLDSEQEDELIDQAEAQLLTAMARYGEGVQDAKREQVRDRS
ncbi:MAG: hypothetical protein J2P36_28200, partial [Ktedonobacteraceae bacterium]|nr:hypothetical protein [Ktedonobacteraceae bacterium]